MTATGPYIVKCPTCKQLADLLFQSGTQNYELLPHKTVRNVKCKTSNTMYSILDAVKTFFSTR